MQRQRTYLEVMLLYIRYLANKVLLKLQTFVMQMWNSVKFEHLNYDIRQV